ncbi:hypothetical protein GCM10015535_13550 [Streptomyces gelaticus]|uniref:Uncharacterized protein n=1 Tax=Streptomyces gelaticus TaxID=285446 RepID=A0ABQ2VTY6_9ACTN|nr:hypothetical protein GCM10015535_13550 [Streptomyces gelaticus]
MRSDMNSNNCPYVAYPLRVMSSTLPPPGIRRARRRFATAAGAPAGEGGAMARHPWQGYRAIDSGLRNRVRAAGQPRA